LLPLGPSVNSKDGIKKLVEAGADVLRLNFSHGTETITLMLLNG